MARKPSTDPIIWIILIALAIPIAILAWLWETVGAWGFIAIALAIAGGSVWWRKNQALENNAIPDPGPDPDLEALEAMRHRSLEAMKKATEARQQDIQVRNEKPQEPIYASWADTSWKPSVVDAGLTDKQQEALLAASNNAYIFNKNVHWHDANSSNTFNTRTLNSLAARGLLDDDGRNRYRLTQSGYDVLLQQGLAPGFEWHPSAFGTLFINYTDNDGVSTEREVEPYNFDRYRMYAYCKMRGGESRTFSIGNVVSAVDADTGEAISDLFGWLKQRANL